MRTIKISILLLICAIAMAGCQNVEKVETQGKIIDGKEVIAKVNDELILKSDYDRQVLQVKSALEANGQDFSTGEGKKVLKEIREKVLEAMINDQLILQQAEKDNITLSEEEFEQAISDLEQYHGGKDALDKYLEQQGLNRSSFEKLVKEQLVISQFKEKLTSDIKVTDEEVKKFYEDNKTMFELPAPEIRASHILVDTENEAKKILAEIKAGADFAALAKDYSKDPGSKELGGDLGYFSKGKMDPEFEKAAFALKPGEISDVVKTTFGYHIIKVTGERTSLSFDDAKDYIKSNLENTKKEEEFNKYLDEWKKQSKIEKYL
ncbi:MAG: peptidylprolyl isomerase [Tepidanaerobacter acetatoxydans]|jgi:foldase protein PrsA|uniref:peptidylprolyl isomerase n=1 Tax=Tepidanaerobacter acetatoxydans TaxID=499229 RepID=UPI00350E3D9C|nr:peptidylprolyl isomerase [Tepidanaerobacter acetatoxydans]